MEQLTNIYAFRLDNGSIIRFRLLTYGEYSSLNFSLTYASKTPNDINEEIYDLCVLDRYFVDYKEKLWGGLVSTIAGLIFHLSGPGDAQSISNSFAVARNEVQGVVPIMQRAILSAFPGYTISAIDSMEWPDLVRLFANAEASLLERNIIAEPFRLEGVSTEEDKQRARGGYDKDGHMSLKKGAVKQEDMDRLNAELG